MELCSSFACWCLKGGGAKGGNCRNFKTIRRISVAAEGLFMVAATREGGLEMAVLSAVPR